MLLLSEISGVEGGFEAGYEFGFVTLVRRSRTRCWAWRMYTPLVAKVAQGHPYQAHAAGELMNSNGCGKHTGCCMGAYASDGKLRNAWQSLSTGSKCPDGSDGGGFSAGVPPLGVPLPRHHVSVPERSIDDTVYDHEAEDGALSF